MTEISYEKAPFGVEMVGPFTTSPYRVYVDGYRVPNVVAYESETREGYWCLMLDERIGTEYMPLEQLQPLIPFIAHCMAVGAGYSCHGENSIYRPNPFKVKTMGISSQPSLTLVKDTSPTDES